MIRERESFILRSVHHNSEIVLQTTAVDKGDRRLSVTTTYDGYTLYEHGSWVAALTFLLFYFSGISITMDLLRVVSHLVRPHFCFS